MKKRAGFRWMGDPEQRIYHVTAEGMGCLVWAFWSWFHADLGVRVEWEPEDWKLTRPVTPLYVFLKTRDPKIFTLALK